MNESVGFFLAVQIPLPMFFAFFLSVHLIKCSESVNQKYHFHSDSDLEKERTDVWKDSPVVLHLKLLTSEEMWVLTRGRAEN